jgi:hypothetical protein
MTLLMMVSLIAVCQYPVIKKIGNQEVVIMTTKQAEDINAKFLRMQDSIKLVSKKIITVQTNNIHLIDSIKNLTVDLKEANNNAKWYQNEVSDYKSSFIRMNKEYTTGITSILLAVVTFVAVVTIHIGKL